MVSVELVGDDKCRIIAADDGDSTDNANSQTQNEDRSCKVCGVGPCTNRCSLCKQVYYCSVDCQRTDWTKGGHRKNCTGRQKKPNKKKNSVPIMGPSIPPPKTVRNEEDAKRALQELWSLTESAMQEQIENVTETKVSSKTNLRKQQSESKTERASNSKLLQKNNCKKQQRQETDNDELFNVVEEQYKNCSFVVEEMPQICRFQLTITSTQTHPEDWIQDSSVHVSAKPIGRAKSRTLIVIRENSTKSSLFAGEFPKPIKASDITWRVTTRSSGKETKDKCTFIIVVRLPYPYDPSNTSSLALGGSIDNTYCNSSLKDATLDEINTVVCGACHLPLVPSTTTATTTTTTTAPPISRVFPLPQGHWDDIADYLICYDGVSQLFMVSICLYNKSC